MFTLSALVRVPTVVVRIYMGEFMSSLNPAYSKECMLLHKACSFRQHFVKEEGFYAERNTIYGKNIIDF